MRLLILSILLSFSLISHSKLSFEEKIDLMYEATPKYESEKIILKRELKTFIQSLSEISNKSRKKQIKKIHELTKDKYLFSYKLSAFFADLISSKTYNCVTGTALFAIIFDELEIPYVIHEVPQHVYLVAYPNSDDISVESTSKKEGLYYWTDMNKTDIVNFLFSTGQVSEYEVKLKGIDEVVDEHFYNNGEHDFEGLAAMHFFNRALYLNDKKKYVEALHFINRSEELLKSDFNEMMKGSILSNLIEEGDLEDINMITYLCSYYNIIEKKAQKQRIEGNFAYVVQEALVTRHDEEYIDSALIIVESELDDQKDRDLFTSLIFEVKSRWYYNRTQYSKSFEFATKGYELNPKNKEFEDMISSLILIVAFEDIPESDEDMNMKLEAYELKYPFLLESPAYLNYSVVMYALLVTEAYLINQDELGDKYLVKMEALLESPIIDTIESYQYIAEAYGSVASYYYRMEEYTVALEWIKKALSFDPDSESMQNKKKYIENKM